MNLGVMVVTAKVGLQSLDSPPRDGARPQLRRSDAYTVSFPGGGPGCVEVASRTCPFTSFLRVLGDSFAAFAVRIFGHREEREGESLEYLVVTPF